MPYVVLIIAIQLLCVIHVIRTGRERLWILGIMIAPLLGSLAYLLLEVLPGFQGNRHLRYAKKKAVAKIDPDREIRAAREMLETTESVANHTRLADALADAERYGEAVDQYQEILSSPHGRDDKLLAKFASALFENSNSSKALELIEQIEPSDQFSVQDQRSLLKARIYEALGRDADAAEVYDDITPRLAGIEARCRYAALLVKMGKQSVAKTLLTEVMHTTRNMDRTQIGDDQPILDWAKATLGDLEA